MVKLTRLCKREHPRIFFLGICKKKEIHRKKSVLTIIRITMCRTLAHLSFVWHDMGWVLIQLLLEKKNLNFIIIIFLFLLFFCCFHSKVDFLHIRVHVWLLEKCLPYLHIHFIGYPIMQVYWWPNTHDKPCLAQEWIMHKVYAFLQCASLKHIVESNV